jgi:hypothetical protein
MANPITIAARQRLFDAGYRPVPPLGDSIDLWANDEFVCAYTSTDNPEGLQGKIKTLMTYDEYKERRKALLQKLIRR